MIVTDLGKYARPVLFENELECYPYSIIGSCVGVEHKEEFYVVTAAHILKRYTADQVRVPYGDMNRNFIPIKQQRVFTNYETEDTDRFDITIFKVADQAVTDVNFDRTTFSVLNFQILDFSKFDRFVVCGFPSEINHIDYDLGKIRNQRLQVTASLLGQSISDGCYELAFDETPMLQNLDGLSGSPVFGLLQIPGQNVYYNQLLGVLLRATRSSGKGHFVSSCWLERLIENNN